MHILPNATQVAALHSYLTDVFVSEDDPISPPGIKSMHLLESACARPYTSIGDVDKYNTYYKKCAALFQSLCKNHAFHNGNKRTALAAMLTALYKEGRILKTGVTDDDLYKFVLDVTSDEFPTPGHGLNNDEVVSQIARWIKNNSAARENNMGDMLTADFIEKCMNAGAIVGERRKDGSYFILNGQHHIKIRTGIRKMAGKVVMKYLSVLRLSENSTGYSREEFAVGPTADREQIYRYIVAFRRLAKT